MNYFLVDDDQTKSKMTKEPCQETLKDKDCNGKNVKCEICAKSRFEKCIGLRKQDSG